MRHALPLVFSDAGDPLLLESQKTDGRLLVLAFSLRRDETDWPLHPTFIPFLDRCLQRLRSEIAMPTEYRPGGLFMNGHNDFVFSDEELENLRTYFEHGGFLFASGCCTNPPFPKAWRRELARVFPHQTVQRLACDHPIYRTFYRIERVRNLHENKNVYLEALFFRGRMVAVLCENGLCCAFTMDNRCNVGRGVSPEDGKKLALNIAIYAMTH